jgi:hypothetical protein
VCKDKKTLVKPEILGIGKNWDDEWVVLITKVSYMYIYGSAYILVFYLLTVIIIALLLELPAITVILFCVSIPRHTKSICGL